MAPPAPDHRKDLKGTSDNAPGTTEDLIRDIMTELRVLRDSVRSVNKEMRLIRAELADIRSSMRNYQDGVIRLEERVAVLEGRDYQ